MLFWVDVHLAYVELLLGLLMLLILYLCGVEAIVQLVSDAPFP